MDTYDETCTSRVQAFEKTENESHRLKLTSLSVSCGFLRVCLACQRG